MVTQAATFAAPNPTMVVFQGHIDALAAANADAEVTGGKPAFTAKRAAVKVVRMDVKKLASYVQNISGGDADMILLSGFEIAKRNPFYGELTPPVNLISRLNKHTGRVALQWKRQDGADMHHVFMSKGNSPYDWVLVGSTPKSRFNMDGLVAGVFYYFAVTAIGAAGESSKSEPCTAMAAA
ncbi:MAG: fibronectin type III domain-containing protein [Flavobacteriales bacterium]